MFVFVFVAPQGPCEEEASKVRPGLLGAFIPQCTVDGNYETRQCHGSTGHCWCVNEQGVELQGTRRGPTEEPVDCDATGENGGQILTGGRQSDVTLLFDTGGIFVVLF